LAERDRRNPEKRLFGGIAGGLVAKRILFRSSNIFNMIQGPPHNIQPWAKARLIEKPELLEGAVLPELYRRLLKD
jgi:hypothetical protein